MQWSWDRCSSIWYLVFRIMHLSSYSYGCVVARGIITKTKILVYHMLWGSYIISMILSLCYLFLFFLFIIFINELFVKSMVNTLLACFWFKHNYFYCFLALDELDYLFCRWYLSIQIYYKACVMMYTRRVAPL